MNVASTFTRVLDLGLTGIKGSCFERSCSIFTSANALKFDNKLLLFVSSACLLACIGKTPFLLGLLVFKLFNCRIEVSIVE